MCTGLGTKTNIFIFSGFIIGVWIGAAAFLGIGIYLAVENPTDNYSAIFNDQNTVIWKMSVYLFIPLGTAIACFGLVGCCGAWREHAFFIWIFCVSMIVCLCGQFAAMVMTGIFMKDVKDNMADQMQRQLVSDYVNETNDDAYSDAWNNIQKDLQCCGSNYYTEYFLYSDFFDNTGYVVPYTCCDGEQDNYARCLSEALGNETHFTQLYRKGCFAQLYLLVGEQVSIIVFTGCLAAAVQIGAFTFGCLLLDRYKHTVKCSSK